MVEGELIGRAEPHLGRVLGLDGFRIRSAEQISGNGLSRSVYRLVSTSAGRPEPRHLVLLLEQKASPAIEPDREAEFAVLRALADVPGIPVAPAVWLETDPAPLGAPFLLTGLLPGTTDPAKLLDADCVPDPSALVERSFAVLGRLAALDVGTVDLRSALAVPRIADVWQIELGRCERVLRDCGGDDLVVTAAAVRQLRRTPPPPPSKLAIVHGDYRLGNYLFDRSGLTGVIDWEMVHLGDPLEDLAWSFLPLWEFGARPGRVGGCITREQAVAAWEHGSGLCADPHALAWWLLFGHLKSVGIWATARHRFGSGRVQGVLPALVGYAMVEKQESFMIDLVREMSR